LPFHGVWVLKFCAKLNKIAFEVCCGFHKIDLKEKCRGDYTLPGYFYTLAGCSPSSKFRFMQPLINFAPSGKILAEFEVSEGFSIHIEVFFYFF